jgi:hypothetical protein
LARVVHHFLFPMCVLGATNWQQKSAEIEENEASRPTAG